MPPVLPRSVTAQLFPSDMLGLRAVMRGTLAPLMLTQRIVQVSQLPSLEAMRQSLLRQLMPAGYFTAPVPVKPDDTGQAAFVSC